MTKETSKNLELNRTFKEEKIQRGNKEVGEGLRQDKELQRQPGGGSMQENLGPRLLNYDTTTEKKDEGRTILKQ